MDRKPSEGPLLRWNSGQNLTNGVQIYPITQPKRRSDPPRCKRKAFGAPMYIGTSPREHTQFIHHDAGFLGISHNPKEFLLGYRFLASQAGSRWLAHSLKGSGLTATACSSTTGWASERISIRQPVKRAANRAFCPSRPMANESW